jgi:hypothetical protein
MAGQFYRNVIKRHEVAANEEVGLRRRVNITLSAKADFPIGCDFMSLPIYFVKLPPTPFKETVPQKSWQKSQFKTAFFQFPTTRRFPSFPATAPAPTSGPRACAFSTRRLKKLTAASAKSSGTKFWPVQTAFDADGKLAADETCRRIQRIYGLASKARSPRRLAAAFAVSTLALRQMLDLYVCLRPVRYFDGTPSPVKNP